MKKVLAIFAVICLVFCFAACTDNGGNNPTEPETSVETTAATQAESEAFKVNVVDAEGNGVKGVMVQICKDVCIPSMTDENGVATFNIEITDEHKLSVLSCPEGYAYNGEAEVYLEEGETEYTVELDAQ